MNEVVPATYHLHEITKLEAENARLRDENRKMNDTLSKDATEIYELQQENARLRALKDALLEVRDRIITENAQLRADLDFAKDQWAKEKERHDASLADNARLRALVEDALRGLHNDFEPDNQSALYRRIKSAFEQQG